MFLISYNLVQFSNKIQQNYNRQDFLMVITSIGSILYAIRQLSHKIVDGASDYSLTKDMMTKLYSISKKVAP
jgi:hypothetical protein